MELIEAAGLQSFITAGHWRRIKCFFYTTASPKIKEAGKVQPLTLLVSGKQVQWKGKTPGPYHWQLKRAHFIAQQTPCLVLIMSSFKV